MRKQFTTTYTWQEIFIISGAVEICLYLGSWHRDSVGREEDWLKLAKVAGHQFAWHLLQAGGVHLGEGRGG